MSHSDSPTPAERIEALAIAQLDAYNRANLADFAACYHPDVRVFDGEVLQYVGRDELADRYGPKFAAGGFGGAVDQRLVSGSTCVDREQYWVTTPTGRLEGEVLVRYTLLDELIGVVQFLRP